MFSLRLKPRRALADAAELFFVGPVLLAVLIQLAAGGFLVNLAARGVDARNDVDARGALSADALEDARRETMGAPRAHTKAFTVTSAANVELADASWPHEIGDCVNTSTGVALFIVNETDTGTSNGKGPHCDTCAAPATFGVGRAWARTSAGSATVRCAFYDRALPGLVRNGGGGGLSSSAADAAYLRLDASNDPLTGQLSLSAAGSIGTPALSISPANTSGAYLVSSTPATWGWSFAGGEAFRMRAADVSAQVTGSWLLNNAAGTAAAPAFAFFGDADGGLYRPAADNTSIAAGGVEVARFNSTGISDQASTGSFSVARGAGSVSAPTYSHAGDTNTGSYRIAADQWGVAVGGILGASVEVTRALTIDGADDSTGSGGITRAGLMLPGTRGADGDAVTAGTCTTATAGLMVFANDTNDTKGDRLCLCVGDAADAATWVVLDIDAVTPVWKKSATCGSGLPLDEPSMFSRISDALESAIDAALEVFG